MVQSDFFDIIDEEEDFEPQHGLTTVLLLMGTAFLFASVILGFVVMS